MSERTMFILENFPEDTYTRDPDSNIYKILDALSTEIDIFMDQVDYVRSSKFLDESTGMDLDKIGKILSVYRFFGESDNDFRNRIKARVPSFIGGGTVKSIESIILEYLKVEATIIEHHKPNNGFSSFHNGVIFGIKLFEKENFNFTLSGGTAYINGNRIILDTFNFTLPEVNGTSWLILNVDGNINIRTSPNKTNDEILLYSIQISNGAYTVSDLKFILDAYTHNITNTATISIQIPFDVDESILGVEEIKNIIISTKAAGIAVLMRIVDTFKESLYIGRDIPTEYFLVGHSFFGSSNKIGYNKSLTSLAKIDGTLKPYSGFTFRELGAAKIGYQDYGGF